jgi:hypothetical protein
VKIDCLLRKDSAYISSGHSLLISSLIGESRPRVVVGLHIHRSLTYSGILDFEKALQQIQRMEIGENALFRSRKRSCSKSESKSKSWWIQDGP